MVSPDEPQWYEKPPHRHHWSAELMGDREGWILGANHGHRTLCIVRGPHRPLALMLLILSLLIPFTSHKIHS